MANKTYKIKVIADTKQAKRGLDDVSKSTGKLKSAMGSLATVGTAVAVFTAGKKLVSLAQEQARAEAQLGAVLRSTGNAAGMSADELKHLASQLQQTTNFGDEATIAGESLLLTFTNIGRDVFPDATRTMLDMSAALGQDLKSSAIQLGKALNDPVMGVTALRRVGVSFTEQQRAQIKAMVDVGDTAGAQALILAELNKEFGGSAEAARDADGGFTALGNTLGDIGESLGALMLPGLTAAAKKVDELSQAWVGLFDNLEKINEIKSTDDFRLQTLNDEIATIEELRATTGEYSVKKLKALTEERAALITSMDALKRKTDAEAADVVLLGQLAIATDAAAEASRGYTLATQDELEAIDKLYASQTNLELSRAGLGSATGTATAAGQFGISQFASGTQQDAATTAGEDAADAYVNAYNAQVEQRKADVSSAVSSVIGAGFGVLGDIAGAIGLGGDDTGRAVAEDARRLAAIAAGDFNGEAAQLLAQSNPELFKKVMESENPAEVAKGILGDFQQGIDTYGLIDKEAAKTRIRNMLFAGEQRQQIMDELTQELLAEGQYSADQIQSAVSGELDTGGLQSAVVNEDQQVAIEAVKTSVLDIGTAAEDTSVLMQESFALAAENLTTVLLPALDEVRMMLERVDVLAVSATGSVTGLGTSVGLEPASTTNRGPGHASGADYIVPPGFPNDSFPMRVSSGERVTVQTPAQQQTASQGQMVTVPVYLDGQKIAEVVSQHQGRRARNTGRLGGHTRL